MSTSLVNKTNDACCAHAIICSASRKPKLIMDQIFLLNIINNFNKTNNKYVLRSLSSQSLSVVNRGIPCTKPIILHPLGIVVPKHNRGLDTICCNQNWIFLFLRFFFLYMNFINFLKLPPRLPNKLLGVYRPKCERYRQLNCIFVLQRTTNFLR